MEKEEDGEEKKEDDDDEEDMEGKTSDEEDIKDSLFMQEGMIVKSSWSQLLFFQLLIQGSFRKEEPHCRDTQ